MSTDSKNSGARVPIVILFGPTAVGKTELLQRLFAEQAEIINADSMQVYRGMDIGTAKPDRQARDRVPHHLIDIRDPDEGYSVGDFVRDADGLAPQITGRGRLCVVSGGSAFYLRTLIYGLPETPRVDGSIKQELLQECEERGLEALRQELARVDPISARRLPAADRYRILRALEVYRSTGRPLSSYAVPATPRGSYRFLIIGLERSRPELYRRIEARVAQMFDRGLATEVQQLRSRGYGFDTPGMRAIGYREFAGYLQGQYSLTRTEELVMRNSRRYAKRQMTFFKQLPNIQWFSPEAHDEIRSLVDQFRVEGDSGG